MQIKTTMRYHLRTDKITVIRKTRNSFGKDVEERKSLCTIGGNVNLNSSYGKHYGVSSKNLKLAYDPSIPLLGIHMKETKSQSLSWRTICTPMFMAALFTITKTWKWMNGPRRCGVYIYGVLFSHKKYRNPAICNNMGVPWGYYAKWNVPDKDKWCMVSFIHESQEKMNS